MSAQLQRSLPTAFFRRRTDTTAHQRHLPLGALAERFRHPPRVGPRAIKGNLPGFVAGRFRAGGRRCAEDLQEVSALVLDVDKGIRSLAEVAEAYQGVAHIAYTTWSHSPEAPRARVIVPLSRPVPAKGWDRTWSLLEQDARRRGLTPDTQCRDGAHLFYLPVRRAGLPYEACINLDATWLDAPLVSASAQAAPTPPPPPQRRAPPSPLDPTARRRVAERLGMQLSGGSARGGQCPQCGRLSVWWLLEPERVPAAMCRHRDSCGWIGSLIAVGGAK